MGDDNEDSTYSISAKLVHQLIVSIIASVVAIGGYMAMWAVNDAAWKAALNEKMQALDSRIEHINQVTRAGVLPIAKERLDNLERRVDRIENPRNGNGK